MARQKLVEGLYDLLVSEELDEAIDEARDDDWFLQLQEAGDDILPSMLSRQLSPLLEAAFETAGRGKEKPERQLELANRIVELLRTWDAETGTGSGIADADQFKAPASRLLAAAPPTGRLAGESAPARPGIPLNSSDLLVNGRREHRLGSELKKELESADEVDLLCAFLKFSGVRVLRDELQSFLERCPGRLRVITTAYMAATERRAIDELADLGANIRISYNTQTTRLHAKAWLFHRNTGFSTAFIGSSNLSFAALLEGLEWNVRVSAVDNPAILTKFSTTFDQYWEDPEFEPYEPERDGPRLTEALKGRKRKSTQRFVAGIHVEPRPHQKLMLDELQAERDSGHRRNLVVAATGTGKTLLSAFDYKRLVEEHGPLSLLFVAHRQEILRQSLTAFQIVMRDGGFGELLVGGYQPDEGKHVFASIQSLHEDRLETFDPDAYDVVIVDEFHHAAANSYVRFLEHVDPRYLIGLTATPERADGLDVKHYFDGRVASELRLWDALDQNLLSPFQYFGITDTADLSSVKFSRRGYDQRQLEEVITGDQFRATRVIQAVEDYVEDPRSMKALGFCVSIDHAEMMATAFNEAGLPSMAVSSRSTSEERSEAKALLAGGELVCLFAVDLFNEGVDIPDVDTALFLRPTESGTVFLQQLGRGLRLAEGKDCLVVLDFVGNAHKRFRYDIKYRALLGGTRRTVMEAVEQGFPHLPPGCSIQLERRAQEYVLDNIRKSLPSNVTGRAKELAEIAAIEGEEVTLGEYIEAAALSLEDVYARAGHSWTDLRRRANLPWPGPGDEDEDTWLRGMSRATHIDDLDRLRSWRDVLEADTPPRPMSSDAAESRRLVMLLNILRWDFNDVSQIGPYFESLWANVAVRRELLQLLDVLEDGLRHPSRPLRAAGLENVPLRVHAHYSRDEVITALGQFRDGRLFQPREGVVWAADVSTDVFFVTLQKTEEEYSPQTLYRDYPISERLFHWESQHTTSEESPTGQRYIGHRDAGTNVLLFVRQRKKVNGITQPYLFLGPVDYVRHQSDRPMQIVWALREPMPAWFYQEAKVAAG